MVKRSEEQTQAPGACEGEPLSFKHQGSDCRSVLVEQSNYDEAVAALELQRNVELIREGIADVEAGRVVPLDEAMRQIRRELRFQPRQTT